MKTIQIVGKRWFQKTYGNTYFSAKAYIDNEPVASIDFEYGYGDHYKHRMLEELQKQNLIPKFEDLEVPWQYTERTGIKILSVVSDVEREKDL